MYFILFDLYIIPFNLSTASNCTIQLTPSVNHGPARTQKKQKEMLPDVLKLQRQQKLQNTPAKAPLAKLPGVKLEFFVKSCSSLPVESPVPGAAVPKGVGGSDCPQVHIREIAIRIMDALV